MLIIYVTNPIWLTITFIFNFSTIIIILHERRKAEINPANQDRKANLMHVTKRATNFIKSSTDDNIFENKVCVLYFVFSILETSDQVVMK